MAIKTRPTMLNGINPLSYVGVNPYTPPGMYNLPRDPTVRDNAGFQIGDYWLNQITNDLWYLAQKSNPPQYQDALWILLGKGPSIRTLTGDVGGPVGPDVNGNIDTLGTAGEILVTGNPGTNTLTWSTGGSVATSYPTDAGTAIPAAGVLNVFGGTAGRDINTTGAGNTIHVELNNAITLGDLAVLAAGVNALTIDTGDISMPAGQHSAATNQKIKMAGGDISFFLNNVLIGIQSGNTTMTPGVAIFNVGIGPQSLQSLTTGPSNTCVGNATGQAITSGSNNCYFGNVAGAANIIGIENCAYGDGSLTSGKGSFNTGYGDGTLQSITTGASNSAFGNQAGGSYASSESNNTVISSAGRVGESNVIRIGNINSATAIDNIFIGNGSGNSAFTVATAVHNLSVGSGTLAALTTGIENVCVGNATGAAITTGSYNTLIGVNNGDAITTGASNTSLGLVALTTLTSGSFNTSIGAGSLGIATTCSHNTAIGYGAQGLILTGSNNISLGEGAGVWTGAESNNIAVGPNSGVVGESNTMRLGKATGAGAEQINKTFVMGVRGITTVVNDAIAVLIDSAGQLGTVSSSIRYKENVIDMDDYSSDILNLRPVTFNYKEHPGKTETGLIAEEVAEILPELVVYKDGQPETVKYHLLVNYLLNELQKLEKRVTELESR